MPERMIYMDNNATTPLHPDVRKAMIEAMEVFGNPSSMHGFGRPARALVEEARARIAAFINATPDEIIFMGSGSEANNTVLSMVSCPSRLCSCPPSSDGWKIITTTIEHPCILESAKCLREKGGTVRFLDVDSAGKIKIDQLREWLSDHVRLVSVMMANNEVGTIQDIREIARIAHENGALFHTDAVQAVGKIPVDVRELDVDFLTLSAHKMYGPKGVGVLYVKKGVPYCPLIRGGHQERGRRAGTENTMAILGMGRAIELRRSEMHDEEKRLLNFKKILREGIQDRIPDASFNGHPADCLPGTLNVSFEGAEGEAILLYLDLEGIAVSTGSACASGSLDPSHVLLALGLSPERAHGSIRISLGRENTMEDIEYMLDRLPKVIGRIRSMSTAFAKRS